MVVKKGIAAATILALVVLLPGLSQEAINTQVWEGNVFASLLSVPWEMNMVVFPDGFFYIVTQEQERSVLFPRDLFKDEPGRNIKDVVFFVHSHIFPGTFSPQDIKTYNDLKTAGFSGHFLLIVWGGRVIEYKGTKTGD